MSKHTEGPWTVEERGELGYVIKSAGGLGSMTLAKIPWRAGRDGANARIMAAAPQMFEALSALMEAHRQVVHGERSHVPADLLIAGDAAVAAAKGES